MECYANLTGISSLSSPCNILSRHRSTLNSNKATIKCCYVSTTCEWSCCHNSIKNESLAELQQKWEGTMQIGKKRIVGYVVAKNAKQTSTVIQETQTKINGWAVKYMCTVVHSSKRNKKKISGKYHYRRTAANTKKLVTWWGFVQFGKFIFECYVHIVDVLYIT